MLVRRAIDPVVRYQCEQGGQGLFTKPVTGLEDGATSDGGGLVFGWDRALYSLIMLFIWGLATDYLLQ